MKISVCIFWVSGQRLKIYSITYLRWNSFTVVFFPLWGELLRCRCQIVIDRSFSQVYFFLLTLFQFKWTKKSAWISMTKVHRGVFLYHCISLLDLFQMSSSCNKWSFLGDGFLLFFFFSMAECTGILFLSLFGFAVDGTRPLGCRTICIADPQAVLFLFFAHANSMRRCLGPLRVTSPWSFLLFTPNFLRSAS